MARRGPSALQVGGELVRTGFQSASDELRNIILMLEVAGLSFVLGHPCRILDREVLEFYQNAKLRSEGSKIKSKVRNSVIRVNPSLLNRYLRLPAISEEEEEEVLEDRDHDQALGFCGLQRSTTSIRRKDMNPEGKLLTDILGKVLLCKTGSHDYLSREMFKLLTVVICRKRINWGFIIFERIKACLQAPNLGRILSLFLNQVDPNAFSMAAGVTLHHLKRIDSSIFTRWERVIPKLRAPRRGDRDDDFEDRILDIVLEKVVPELPSAEGEHTSDHQDASSDLGDNMAISEDVDIHEGDGGCEDDAEDRILDIVLEKVVPEQVVSEAVISQGISADKVAEDVIPESASGDKILTKEFVQENVQVAEKEVTGSILPRSDVLLLPPAPTQAMPTKVTSPVGSHSSSFVSNKGVFGAPLVEESSAHSNHSLLQSIEVMFIKQKEYFDFSLKQVYDKVKEVEKSVNDGLNLVRHDMSQFKTGLDASGGIAMDRNINIAAHNLTKLADLSEDHNLMHTAADNFKSFVDNQMIKDKNQILISIQEEVRKGEVKLLDKIDEVSFELKDKIQQVNAYTHETSLWLHGELTGSIPVLHFEDSGQHGGGDQTFPFGAYHQVWSDPSDSGIKVEKEVVVAKAIPESSSRKRKIYGEGPSAKRADHSKG